MFRGTLWMVFHIFGLSGLEQVAFFHNLGQMKEALPLNSLFNYFETTPNLMLYIRGQNDVPFVMSGVTVENIPE